MRCERPLVLPDVDREIEQINQDLLKVVHELRRLEDYIRGEEAKGDVPWIASLKKEAAAMRADGKAKYDELCKLRRLSEATEFALTELEHARECPDCSEFLPTN